MPIPTPNDLAGLAADLVRHLGARMFVGFTALSGLLAGLFLLGHGAIDLTQTVAVVATVTLGVVAAAAIIGRTLTDILGTPHGNPSVGNRSVVAQPPAEPHTSRGE